MNTQAWRYYLNFYKGTWPRLAFAVFISMGQSLFVLPIAFLVGYTFDQVIPQNDFRLLILIGLGILLLQIASSSLSLYVRYVSLKVTKAVIRQIREDILERFYTYSQAFYSQADRTRLHTVAVQDTERLDEMSNALIAVFLPALSVSIALVTALFFLDWILSCVFVFVSPILYWLTRLLYRKIKEQANRFQRAFEAFSEGLLFVLQMIDLTRILSSERFEIKRQKENIDQLRAVSRRGAWWNAAFVNIQRWIFSLAGILVLIMGGWGAGVGRITIGELITFYVAVGLLRSQVNMVTSSIPEIIAGIESLDSLYDLLQIKSPPPYNGTRKIDPEGELIFNAVDFQYGQEPLLRDINLRIPPKGIIAITGSNGVGKSSLIYLLMGFYQPQKGELLAGDHPYSQLDILHLRRFFGVVHQAPILFQGSILENIVYGRDEVSEEDFNSAVHMSTADEFITELPDGYDTIIGERGIRLSGGERQRIAIARALLRVPIYLFLDEPTNHLDSNTTTKLMENIEAWSQDRSILIISHKQEVIQKAELIYHLADGKVEYIGPGEG